MHGNEDVETKAQELSDEDIDGVVGGSLANAPTQSGVLQVVNGETRYS
jgi:hypothetical protein